MDNIIDLLIEYSKLERFVDYKLLSSIFKICQQEDNLSDVAKRIILSWEYVGINEKTVIMSHSYIKNEVYSNMYVVEKVSEKIFNAYFNVYKEKYQLSVFEGYLLTNSFIIQYLFHELEHAKQSKKIYDIPNDLETALYSILYGRKKIYNQNILKYWFTSFSFLKWVRFCEENYSLMPTERLAEIYSLIKILKILKRIDEDVSSVRNIMFNHCVSKFLSGYDVNKIQNGVIIGPTIEFLNKLNNYNNCCLKEFIPPNLDLLIEKAQSTSLVDRLKLGLNITENDFENKDDQTISLSLVLNLDENSL